MRTGFLWCVSKNLFPGAFLDCFRGSHPLNSKAEFQRYAGEIQRSKPKDPPSPLRSVSIAGRHLALGRQTYVMGILNLTPDSFSDGGLFLDPGLAEDRALALQDQGACILDLGGESTRPGAPLVGEDEELERVLPVIRRLVCKLEIPISIDSRNYKVQKAAVEAGASIINDVSGGSDPRTFGLAESSKCALILMHMRGSPGSMQKNPRYSDVVDEVMHFLKKRAQTAEEHGVPSESVLIDPGIGFGKTLSHNLELMRNLSRIGTLGYAVVVGPSRKSWIGKVTGRPVHERAAGSAAAAALCAASGADFVRAHDVQETSDAVKIGRSWTDQGQAP